MTNSETILSASSHVGDSSVQTATGDKYKGTVTIVVQTDFILYNII